MEQVFKITTENNSLDLHLQEIFPHQGNPRKNSTSNKRTKNSKRKSNKQSETNQLE